MADRFPSRTKIAVIGPTTPDVFCENEEFREELGGATIHTGLALADLGVKTGIFTTISREESVRAEKAFNHGNIIDYHRIPSESTSVFINHYVQGSKGDQRKQRVIDRADAIIKNHLPHTKLRGYTLLYFTPLLQSDISHMTLKGLLQDYKGSNRMTSLAIQGMLR